MGSLELKPHGRAGAPCFLISSGCMRSFDEFEEQIYLHRIAFCIDLPELWNCGFFSDPVMCLWVCARELASCPFIHVCVGSPGGWTQRCDLHESAGSRNYQQPMQDLPNLYWRRFKDEAPHSADLSLTPLFAHSPRTTETLSFRELSVFSQHEEEED